MTILQIPPKVYLALTHTNSKEEARFYLAGIYFCAQQGGEGTIAVSTDGHRMGVYTLDGIDCPENVIVKCTKPMIAAARALLKTDPERAMILIDLETKRFECYGGPSFGDCLIDGTFPDWSRIVPEGRATEPALVSVNPAYVADFGKVAKELGYGNKSAVISFFPTDNPAKQENGEYVLSAFTGAPIIVGLNDPNYSGIIMPMRSANPQAPVFPKPEQVPELENAA
jgi:DNA polymerase III sliding clamp (beta) subunit (PCNA family)